MWQTTNNIPHHHQFPTNQAGRWYAAACLADDGAVQWLMAYGLQMLMTTSTTRNVGQCPT